MGSSTLKFGILVLCLASTVFTVALVWGNWEMVRAAERSTLDGLSPPASEGDRSPASLRLASAVPVVTLDEVYVSLGTSEKRGRSLVVNLDLELFDEKGRETVDKFRSAVRDLVLQSAMEQPYESLKTLPGKLSFKEILVGRINTLVNQPVVRDVHFASFYLQ